MSSHELLIARKKNLSCNVVHSHCLLPFNLSELGRFQCTFVDDIQNEPIDYRASQVLYHISGKRSPPVPGAVQEAEEDIKSAGLEKTAEFVKDQHVTKTEKRIDGVRSRVVLVLENSKPPPSSLPYARSRPWNRYLPLPSVFRCFPPPRSVEYRPSVPPVIFSDPHQVGFAGNEPENCSGS